MIIEAEADINGDHNMDKKRNLEEDQKHTTETSERWTMKVPRNRNIDLPGYKDEWYSEQCFACQYYMHLQGYLRTDWGVCSHPASPLDGRVVFEHDGCEQFSPVDEEDDELIELMNKLVDEMENDQNQTGDISST